MVVTPERAAIDAIPDRFSENVFPLQAAFDNTDKLRRVSLPRADRALMNVASDTDALIHLRNLRDDFPDVDFAATLRNVELRPTFQSVGVNVIAAEASAAHLIASIIFEPDVARLAEELITTARHGDDYEIRQHRIEPSSPAAGMTYGRLFQTLYDDHRVLPLGASTRREGGSDDERHLRKLPNDDLQLAAGDDLILIGRDRDVAPLAREWDLPRSGPQ